MKLKHYTKANCQPIKGRNQTPKVSLGGKNGMISINKTAVTALGLKAGDHVIFGRDEKRRDWFLITKPDNSDEAFQLRTPNKFTDRLILVNKRLAHDVIHDTVIRPEKRVNIKEDLIDYKKTAYYRICTKQFIDEEGKEYPNTYALVGGQIL